MEKHRFVNLDEVLLHEAHKARVWGVEQVSDDLCQMFDPGDLAQLCVKAVCMHSFHWSLPLLMYTLQIKKNVSDWVSMKSERAEMFNFLPGYCYSKSCWEWDNAGPCSLSLF